MVGLAVLDFAVRGSRSRELRTENYENIIIIIIIIITTIIIIITIIMIIIVVVVFVDVAVDIVTPQTSLQFARNLQNTLIDKYINATSRYGFLQSSKIHHTVR